MIIIKNGKKYNPSNSAKIGSFKEEVLEQGLYFKRTLYQKTNGEFWLLLEEFPLRNRKNRAKSLNEKEAARFCQMYLNPSNIKNKYKYLFDYVFEKLTRYYFKPKKAVTI